jgi:isoleucyl-tRNA synthetase
MPFAQHHAPFENETAFKQKFPADFICEAIDQTRGWFYSLLSISTLLFGKSSYKTVLCLGHIADTQGRKMSKSLGNVVDPWQVVNEHGADAFRWYYLTSTQPWDGYLFSAKTVGESVRQFLLQLWNTYGFFILYANVNKVDRESIRNLPSNDRLTELDRWAVSRLNATIETVTDRLDDYDATNAGRAIAEYVDELSNWYIRRSRRRFWDGDPTAFAVLNHCLVTVAKLVAPFTPFIADEIYENLDASKESVHLCDFPQATDRDHELEDSMAVVRETVRLGLAARGQARIKVRQPLRAAVIVVHGSERESIESLAGIVRDELNVKELRYVSEADELASYVVKPNYRTLGPRFGKQMPQVAAAIQALDPTHVAELLRQASEKAESSRGDVATSVGEQTVVGISIDGHDHELSPDELMLTMQPIEGYQLQREGSHAVALELELDDELIHEGWAREIVHAVQNARKTAGLEVEDRIDLILTGTEDLMSAAQEHTEYVTGETLAITVSYGGVRESSVNDDWKQSDQTTVDGNNLVISLRKAVS